MSQHAAKLEQVRALMDARPQQAQTMCQRIVQAAPKDPWAASVMSAVLLRQGQTVPALHYAQRAAELSPKEPYFQVEWAKLLGIENQHAKAAGVLRGVLAANPGDAGATYQLAMTLELMDLHGEAERVCRGGLAERPDDEGLQALLAGALLNLGRIEETVGLTMGAAARHPENAVLASGLALMMNYMPGVTPAEVFAAHQRYAELLARQVPVPARVYANVRDPERRLRVGVVSPDLRRHSVAAFVEQWFEHYDRDAIEMVVYQTNRVADDVTERLKGLIVAPGFRPVSDVPGVAVPSGRSPPPDTGRKPGATGRWHVMDNISDVGLAEKIFADRIDVLIEMSGHTHAHSLTAMHLRPAPVQVTYLGYPNTTGLPGIDYRIIDSITDPAGAEAFASEKLLRLDPCFLCYKPPLDAPEPAPPPSLKNGFVTFGSFNTVQKLNRQVVRVWAEVLKGVPGSKLLLKGGDPADLGLREGVIARFAAAGLEPSRVEFLARTKGTREHLELYSRIDVALDPFPYNGTTTTCEALYMGVPVVTLAGQMHAGRVGASLLARVGLESLVAADEAAYVRLAGEIAADIAGRDNLRTQLRAGSPVQPGAMGRRSRAGWRVH